MTQPDGGGNGPANSGQGGGIPATLFTQEQVNHFNAEAKRGAVANYFKELGLDKAPSGEELSAALTDASEYRKLKAGEKTEVQRLNDELATTKETAAEVPTLKTQLLRAKLAGDAGLKSRYWKYVEGDDEDSIKASIQETLGDIKGGGDGSGDEGEQPDGQQPDPKPPVKKGTGSLAPNPQQGTGGGGTPKSSMAAGRDAYKSKRGDKE